MTLALQAAGLSALAAVLYVASVHRDHCVKRSAEPVAASAPGEPARYRLTLVNACDRPIRAEAEFSCAGRVEQVTRHLPASGAVSWTQAAPGGRAPCDFSAWAAGW